MIVVVLDLKTLYNIFILTLRSTYFVLFLFIPKMQMLFG